MFGLFKKKKRIEFEFVRALQFDNLTYAKVVSDLFENMDLMTRAHVVVAYENLLPFLTAYWQAAKEAGEDGSVEQFIGMAAKRLDEVGNDEILSRRWAWFLFAAMLGRLEKLSFKNPEIVKTGAEIWCALVSEIPRLKGLLPDNVVWKPEEKEWFNLSMDDNLLVQYSINNVIPPMFAKHESVKAFANSRRLHYWPSGSRIGAIL
jgi:hypothetical protein